MTSVRRRGGKVGGGLRGGPETRLCNAFVEKVERGRSTARFPTFHNEIGVVAVIK